MSKDAGKFGTLVESVAQIAHAFERLVRLAEDWSDTIGLPKFNDPPPVKPGKKKSKKIKKKEHPHDE